MQRDVRSRIRFTASGPTRVTLAIAADHPDAEEQFRVAQDGTVVTGIRELRDAHGSSFRIVDISGGAIEIDYSARIVGQAEPPPVSAAEELLYLRPSRYCESDALAPRARVDFAGLTGSAAVDAVVTAVSERLSYVPGASGPFDGAVATLDSGAGVCRDYAHSVVALLRALDIPARVAAVYAPGLAPMDFHAVAEVALGGVWHVVDATRLAPRQSFVRIAAGRDAADIAFLDTSGPDIVLDELMVMAIVDELPVDDGTDLVTIR